MDKSQAMTLCHQLNLGELIVGPHPVEGGLLHLMWQIKATTGEYAVKELNPSIMQKPNIEAEYERSEVIAHAFAEKGISAVASMMKQDQSLIKIDNSVFITYPWVQGKALSKDAIDAIKAEKIAIIIAKMHLLNLQVPGLPIPTFSGPSHEYIQTLAEKTKQATLPFSETLHQQLNELLGINEQTQQAMVRLNRHLVVSHGDLDQKNVLWIEDAPFLIDWEGAGFNNPTREILCAALDWAGMTTLSLNLDVFHTMLNAYKKAGGVLSDNLQDAMDGILGGWLNWLVYNIERSLGMNNATQTERVLGIQQVDSVLRILQYVQQNRNRWIKS